MNGQIPQARRPWLAAIVFSSVAATAGASAEVIHYGPNEPYRPIQDAHDLVVNGNFNADPLVDPSNPFITNPHITGWTVSPENQFPGTRNSNAGVGPDGRGLRLGDLNLVTVSQTLSTVVDQTYQLSFFFAVDGDPGNLFRVSAGAKQLANLDGTPYLVGYGYFSQYIYDFKATSTQTPLAFEYQSPIGDQHLSNVSVLAVPEPGQWVMLLAGLGVLGLARFSSAANITSARIRR